MRIMIHSRAECRAGAQGNEGGLGAKLVRGGAGGGRDFGEAVGERGDGVAVALEGLAFVVGELQLLQQLLDAVLDRQ
jgi:hypothetical protein